MIISICDEPKVLEIMKYLNIFISIIRIIVPIILIFSLMLKFVSVIKIGNEDELAKVKKVAVVNVTAAVIIFLIPNIISIIVKIGFKENDYNNCLNVNNTVITQAYENKMERLVSKVEETFNQYDYNNAVLYLKNIKDETKEKAYKERLDAVKKKIDELRKKQEFTGTGLGKDIVASEELIEACKWVLHADEIPVRLYTCQEPEYAYKDPEKDLPGGATYVSSTGQYRAKEAIPLSTYQMGVFFGEEHVTAPPQSRYAFMLIYKTEFLHTTVYHAINRGEVYDNRKITYENKSFAGVYFRAGSCAQNYRNSQKVQKYDSGQYKAEIDDTVENTKYFVIADDAGKDYGRTTNVIYHSYTGIEEQIEKAGAEGKTFVEIIEQVVKSGNDDSHRYKNARVYDCRNLVEDGTIKVDWYTPTTNNNDDDTDISKIDKDIIYLGDSRTKALQRKQTLLGMDTSKEFVFAKDGTGLDENFRSQMSEARDKMKKNNTKTYAVTVNYGVNTLKRYEGFCNYYVDYVNTIDSKNNFYIISVNPTDPKRMTSGSQTHSNELVEEFNDYMKNTCINRIKEKSPDHNVYYCDIYNSLSNQKWIDEGYISNDGLHYTNDGYKYIYDKIKECIAKNK